MTIHIGRREFIVTVSGAAAAWPLAARAQHPERMRRIGVLMPLAADDAEGQARLTACLQGLRESGWTDGRNLRIDTRWTAGKPDEIRKYAAEFAALAPDVILAAATPIVAALQPLTRTGLKSKRVGALIIVLAAPFIQQSTAQASVPSMAVER
jgi:putative ABC transport system substrate-binding protein